MTLDPSIIAQILPPMLREDLIDAGLHHDCSQIDEIHNQLRSHYPKLFRSDDDPTQWGKRYEQETKSVRRVK